MANVPSPWGLTSSPVSVNQQVTFRPVTNSLTSFVGATAITAVLTQTITPTTLFHDDPVARIVTLTLVADATVVTRNLTVRITGIDGYGQTRTEDIPLVGATAGQTRHYFSRWAYRALTLISFTAKTAIGAADTISAGVVILSATLGANIGTQTNGASLTHWKGFQLPIPPKNTLSAASPTTLDQCEVFGVAILETAAAASTVVAMSRGAGFLVDAQYNVLVTATTQHFILTGDNTGGTDIRALIVDVQTNRGE